MNMSTNGYTNWAVDLGDVGAIYPFQGWELTMVVIGIVFWLGWHRIQFNAEKEELERAARGNDKTGAQKAIDQY
jgi:hypothetical protein